MQPHNHLGHPQSASANVCALAGTTSAASATVAISNRGTCAVQISQAGTSTYAPAPQKTLALTIGGTIQLVDDGGFEAGDVPIYWTSSTSLWNPVICNQETGFYQPHTGNHWSQFIGMPESADTSTLQQTGVIAPGPKTLKFHVWWASSVTDPSDPTASFTVKIDGNTVFNLTPATAAAYHNGYTPVTVDVSAYADGNSHTLSFTSNTAAEADDYTVIVLDDVSISPPDAIFANGFQ